MMLLWVDWDWLKVFPAKKTVDIMTDDRCGWHKYGKVCLHTQKNLWNKSGNDT